MELTDAELIRSYLESSDEAAFKTLLERYHAQSFRRFMRWCGNHADAQELTQELWIRVIENLESYTEQGKFSHYLATIARHLLDDYWRRLGVRKPVHAEWAEDEDQVADYADKTTSVEDAVITREAIEHLVTVLIPQLPCDQRMIYLLRHESEHWEEKKRLEWSHLAELNGLDVGAAWQGFERARKELVQGASAAKSVSPECEDLLLFLVWTQAQRPSKEEKYTETYFAELTGVPVNTLKTRYRAATSQLMEGMKVWREQ